MLVFHDSLGAQACNKAMKLVDETPYEITCDIHGVQNGPRLGRLRLLNEVRFIKSHFLPQVTHNFMKLFHLTAYQTMLETAATKALCWIQFLFLWRF